MSFYVWHSEKELSSCIVGTKIHCSYQFQANPRKERTRRLYNFTLCFASFLKIKTATILPSGLLNRLEGLLVSGSIWLPISIGSTVFWGSKSLQRGHSERWPLSKAPFWSHNPERGSVLPLCTRNMGSQKHSIWVIRRSHKKVLISFLQNASSCHSILL